MDDALALIMTVLWTYSFSDVLILVVMDDALALARLARLNV